MADAAHGASGAHPFFRVLKGFMDEPGEGFSLAGAVRMAEEFAFLGGKDKPARPRREPEDGLHARFRNSGNRSQRRRNLRPVSRRSGVN